MTFIKRLVKRVLTEAALPTCAGVAWGVYVYTQKHTVVDAISAAGIAFFFVLALQGQILRVGKNVRDEQDAEDFRGRFDSIQQGLDELRAQRAATQEAPLETPPDRPAEKPIEPKPHEAPLEQSPESLVEQANHLITAGRYFPAVLTAAVAFEFAARDMARNNNWDAERVPLGMIIRELAEALPKVDAIKLDTLNRLRNSIVHAEREVPWIGRDEARETVGGFEEGIALLAKAYSLYPPDREFGKRHPYFSIRRPSRGIRPFPTGD